MNRFRDSISKYFKNAPAIHIDKVYDGGNKYLFKIRNDLYKEKDLMDPWYTIDKKTFKINGFLPYTDIKWFNNTIKNEVKSFL